MRFLTVSHKQWYTEGVRDISEFVRLKYVEGKWLSDEMRARYKLGPRAGVVVGLALGEPGSGAITGVAR